VVGLCLAGVIRVCVVGVVRVRVLGVVRSCVLLVWSESWRHPKKGGVRGGLAEQTGDGEKRGCEAARRLLSKASVD
jgi:hypothetical protein